MPLPKSISFNRVALPAGFETQGIVNTRRSIKAPDGSMVDPISSSRFACLDDPEAVDAFRQRTNPAAAVRFDRLVVVPRMSQIPTIGADGAILLFKNATIKEGQRFMFAWNFMTWGDRPWNDFACFEARPDVDGGYGLSRQVLYDLVELAHDNKRTTGWRFVSWTALADFAGTLEWTVANGQEITDPTKTEPAPEAFTNPPALLIDNIHLSG